MQLELLIGMAQHGTERGRKGVERGRNEMKASKTITIDYCIAILLKLN